MNAAEKWGVDAATLRTEPGFVINPANGQRLAYGEIAAFGKVPAKLPKVDAKELKARKDWRLIGKGVPRRDMAAKVNGTANTAWTSDCPGWSTPPRCTRPCTIRRRRAGTTPRSRR